MINKNKNDDKNEIDLKRKLIDDPISQMNKQQKKESVDDKKKKKKKTNNNNDVEIKKKKTIEELRVERLKRENEEKIKTQRLLNGPSTSSNVSSIQLDDRKRRYNSQFNPDLARY